MNTFMNLSSSQSQVWRWSSLARQSRRLQVLPHPPARRCRCPQESNSRWIKVSSAAVVVRGNRTKLLNTGLFVGWCNFPQHLKEQWWEWKNRSCTVYCSLIICRSRSDVPHKSHKSKNKGTCFQSQWHCHFQTAVIMSVMIMVWWWSSCWSYWSFS